MATTVYDIRKYLNDKRLYKSLLGHELDFSFRPVAIDEMYRKYVELERQVASSLLKYQGLTERYTKLLEDNIEDVSKVVKIAENKEYKDIEKETSELQQVVKDTREAGINIIKLAAHVNGQEFVDDEWVNNNLDPREFGFIIRFVMGTEDVESSKKK